MTKKRMPPTMAVALMLVILIICTGCTGNGFSTKIISDADKPEVVLDKFFTELKSGNYEACNQYLADNATFVVTDTSGYEFMDELLKIEREKLNYELIGDAIFDSMQASCEVRIITLNAEKLTADMKANIGSFEYAYLEENGETSFDINNKTQVSGAIRLAMQKYADSAGTVENTVTVNFVYQNEAWKIKVDSDLTSAVFGGGTDE